MPRYARYKRYYRKVYPRKRWASQIKSDTQQITVTPGGVGPVTFFNVCKNSHVNVTPTPTILKFGRFRLKGDVRTTGLNASNVTTAHCFVVFVPEGMTLDGTIVDKHPEYILGWSVLSMDSGNSFSITSSLKRNLNSGDSIQILFYLDCTTLPTANVVFNFAYTIQFWTSTA